MKFFNTAGPVDPARHYFVPHRFDEALISQLIEQQKYFVLHAPRQSGKTTGVRMLVKQLNESGKFQALYVNVESAQTARNNYLEGMRTMLMRFRSGINETFGQLEPLITFLTEAIKKPTGSSLYEFLQHWAQHSAQPIVLFIDEIDSLVGDTLIAVLRQLRDGYASRPHSFPQSICLIGVRDVRDYRIWSEENGQMVLGGSAFNIKAESLTLPDFTSAQLRDLYLQHTRETGQPFTDDAIECAFYLTQGQPWLANALAYQVCFRAVTDRSIPVTKAMIEAAKEELIRRCDTHLDVLIDRLNEPRVANVIDAVLSGRGVTTSFPHDDVQYVRDLGLVKKDGYDIANPIYQEIIPRALALTTQEQIRERSVFYQNPDGSIDMHKLLEKFVDFYRENSATWLADFQYKESGPHILMMAFLQRVINGGGTIHREYALDRKRVDLRIDWPQGKQRIVIELKIWHGPKALASGLEQTAEYMDLAAATEGHLVIFDRDTEKSWETRIYQRIEQVGSKQITVWGL